MAVQTSGGLLTRAVMKTQDSPRVRRDALARLQGNAADAGRLLEFHYEPKLHHRSIELSTGIVILSDRGLDLYEAPPVGLRRHALGRSARACRGGIIEIFNPDPVLPRNIPPSRRILPGRSSKRCIARPKLGGVSPLKKTSTAQQFDCSPTTRDSGQLERERARMMAEHAAALAPEEYEYWHDGNEMTNEEIKRD